MSKKDRKQPRPSSMPTATDQARDELFSHILRCGVLEAAVEHQKEWMDDTMGYIADRYPELGQADLEEVRVLGERYCQPVVKHTSASEQADAVQEAVEADDSEVPATVDAGA